MATAEIGALRVSLSLDSAAFSAGTRAATASAQVASNTIATSFQTASARVTASFATMGAAMQNQMRAGLLQQVGQLRTGILGLISPVGLLIGGAAAGLTGLFGAETRAEAATRLHTEALDRLNQQVTAARDRSPEYIQARQNEAAADLQAAQAAVAMAQARLEAFRSQHRALAEEAATMNPVQLGLQGMFGVGVGGAIMDTIPEMREIEAEVAAATEMAADLERRIIELRGQAARTAAILREGGTVPGMAPASSTEAGRQEEFAKLTAYQQSILDKQRDFEARQTEIVRQGEEQRRALREASLSSVASIFGSLARIVGEGSERAFKISKAFSIGEAAINTGLAITKALAGPFPFITAAAVAASGAAQIAGIVRAQPGNASVPAVSGGGTAAGAAAGGGASSSAGHAVNITLSGGDSFNRTSVRELIGRINDEVRDGAKLITVS